MQLVISNQLRNDNVMHGSWGRGHNADTLFESIEQANLDCI